MTASRLSKNLIENMEALESVGAVDKITARNFRQNLLLPECAAPTPKMLRALRKKERISQAVLALALNVKTTTVQKWERGVTAPSGTAARLIELINRHGISIIGFNANLTDDN